MDQLLADRVVGSVLGLALGDALGAPFEGGRAHDIPDPLPAFELAWGGAGPGSTTDDTAMAHNVLRSIVARGGLDTDDILRRHLEWFATDPPGVGGLTRRVLARAAAGERDAARAVWEERGPEVSATNGSVMACAPLGLAYANRPEELHELAPRLSVITHWDGRCRTACTAITLCVAALARGEPRAPSVQSALVAVEDREGGEELEFLTDAAGTTRPIDGPDMGFCLFTAGVALQTAATDLGFEEGVRRVVSLGGDTDTNAAVTGALMGAAQGRSCLPDAWVGRLRDGESIEREAALLVPLAGAET